MGRRNAERHRHGCPAPRLCDASCRHYAAAVGWCAPLTLCSTRSPVLDAKSCLFRLCWCSKSRDCLRRNMLTPRMLRVCLQGRNIRRKQLRPTRRPHPQPACCLALHALHRCCSRQSLASWRPFSQQKTPWSGSLGGRLWAWSCCLPWGLTTKFGEGLNLLACRPRLWQSAKETYF